MTHPSAIRFIAMFAAVSFAVPGASAQSEPAQPPAMTASQLPAPTGEHLPDKLPAGESKVLQAVVMDARGTAEWRPSEQDSWKAAQVDDLLSPGAQIRTGRQSSLSLRVGHNATVMVSAMTRVDLPSIVQDGETLRTRASIVRGKADFKVDQVGLTNDFKVMTPSTTLAVRGTGFGVGWGGLEGAKVQGLAGNDIRAVEIKYFLSKLMYYISQKGTSTEKNKEPLQGALFDTVSPPAAMALGLETAQIAADSGLLPNLATLELLDIDQAHQAFEQTQEILAEIIDETDGGGDGDGDPESPFDDVFGESGLSQEDSVFYAELLCFHLEFFDSAFLSGLIEAELEDSKSHPNYNQFMSQLSEFCQGAMEDIEDPLFDFLNFIVSYCSTFPSQGQIDTCIFEASEALGETVSLGLGGGGKGGKGKV